MPLVLHDAKPGIGNDPGGAKSQATGTDECRVFYLFRSSYERNLFVCYIFLRESRVLPVWMHHILVTRDEYMCALVHMHTTLPPSIHIHTPTHTHKIFRHTPTLKVLLIAKHYSSASEASDVGICSSFQIPVQSKRWDGAEADRYFTKRRSFLYSMCRSLDNDRVTMGCGDKRWHPAEAHPSVSTRDSEFGDAGIFRSSEESSLVS